MLLIFAVSALALIGLAWVLGQATESLGDHSGPRIGGILNATFGNAAELIITIFALSAGLTTVVKASIIGSIIGNVLLVLGASLLFGGLKNGTQTFSSTIAGINASMLAIVAVALSLPTIFAATNPGHDPDHPEHRGGRGDVRALRPLPALHPPQPGGPARPARGQAPFGRTASFVLLFVATAAVAFVSEAFVGAIEPLTEEFGISELFVGVIIVPIVGNIAEHIVGVQIAYKNDMDFSMGISLGSSIQVALLVTPILVFLGPLLGHPLNLTFTPLELGALGAAVVVTGFVALDGEVELARRRDALRRLPHRRPGVLLLAVDRRYRRARVSFSPPGCRTSGARRARPPAGPCAVPAARASWRSGARRWRRGTLRGQ